MRKVIKISLLVFLGIFIGLIAYEAIYVHSCLASAKYQSLQHFTN